MASDSLFHQLVNRNEDLKRLVEKGYAIGFDSNYLLVRDIPYLDVQGALQIGAIVTKYVSVDGNQIVPDDHQIFFAGAVPHNLDGTPVANLGGGVTTLALSEAASDVVVQRSFSNRPTPSNRYEDFLHKIETYVGLISGPAMSKYGVDPFTFRIVEEIPDSVFKFHDTLTSRAEITDLAGKFHDEIVAIIGLGGTGAYLLDFLAKTAVREIRAFDFDRFYQHNAFRAPGRVRKGEFGRLKSEVYSARYGNFRKGLVIKDKFIDSSCVKDLKDVTFAFVCVDKGSARKEIFDLLLSQKIPFIDVGMGLNRKHGPLAGMLRATYFSPESGEQILGKGLVELEDQPDDVYRNNIQISELNAMNAVLAITKYKQIKGFYFEEAAEYQRLFDLADSRIVGEHEV